MGLLDGCCNAQGWNAACRGTARGADLVILHVLKHLYGHHTVKALRRVKVHDVCRDHFLQSQTVSSVVIGTWDHQHTVCPIPHEDDCEEICSCAAEAWEQSLTKFLRPLSFARLSISAFCVFELDTATILLLGYLAAMKRLMEPQPQPSSSTVCPSPS